MRILVSNDDGYFAEGINCLIDALSTIAELTVVAPDRNRSGASNSLTLDNPIRVSRTEKGYYSVSGTPTDCIHLGTHHIMDETPDMVVAGINHGANLGDDVLYSGTVAAAMEGRALGMPSIAVSLHGLEGNHFSTAAHVVIKLIERLKTNPLPPDEILNINVPDVPLEDVAGIKITRCGKRHRHNTIVPSKDPKGREVFWLGPPAHGDDVSEGTDFYWIEKNYVAVTPLHVDLTAHPSIPIIEDWARDFKL
ncbi:MAG: 5'/3'-nucleotidase SurE [Pseudomonadota bacterium]